MAWAAFAAGCAVFKFGLGVVEDVHDSRTFPLKPHEPGHVTGLLALRSQSGAEKALLDRFACVFEWSGSGGSSEEWNIEFEAVEDGGVIKCTVGRSATASYFLFSSWKLAIKGNVVQMTSATVNVRMRFCRCLVSFFSPSNLMSVPLFFLLLLVAGKRRSGRSWAVGRRVRVEETIAQVVARMEGFAHPDLHSSE